MLDVCPGAVLLRLHGLLLLGWLIAWVMLEGGELSLVVSVGLFVLRLVMYSTVSLES